MGNKLVPKIILEGTRLTFKTDLLDISDNDIPRAAERIADWMESTGGLYL